jgi:L-ascorbate metabolism protein UlaG (beta-lactamase superfamily)
MRRAAGIGIGRKFKQLWRLVRESHTSPMLGSSKELERTAEGEVGVTWIGHSSFLIQVAGKCVLVDPVFSKRLILLRRQRVPGLDWRNMPAIDLVLLTHAHMDHLDFASLRRTIRRTRKLTGKAPEVVVPVGVEDLVSRMGFAAVHGLEWWQRTVVAGLTVTMTPARHWGARLFKDTHRGFGGYVIEGGGQSVYHSGDTAYFAGFHDVRRRLSPQIALLPIGAYFPDSYRSVHTSPEEALQAFIDSGAEMMVPMHFGTFRLGREPMEEPPVRLMAAARRHDLEDRVRVLEEGETLRIPARESVERVLTALLQ